MMTEPIIVADRTTRLSGQPPIAAIGQSFDLYEWSGSGPGYLHVHYADDEAWHILEGTLTFRFGERQIEAAGPTRYLMILTPRLRELIAALHAAPIEEHAAIMGRFASAIVE